MRKIFQPVSALLLVFAAAGAHAVPMSDLLAGDSMTVNDKIFDDWKIIDLDISNPDQPAPDYAMIDVQGLDDNPANPGLRFELNGQMDVVGSDLGEWVDLWFFFSVATADGSALIKDVSADLTGFEFEGGGGVILIEEEVSDMAGESLADLWVESDNLLGEFQLTDGAEFDPQARIFVEKNILVAADFEGDIASLNSFEQRFSQVPEPAVLVLMGIGLAGIGYARRRRG